jgi:divalent metal cation (Fe/Co/Zn/Cd) transporter
LIGIVIAALGTAGAEVFGAPVLDGVASLGIAAVLAATAAFLANESKGLLIGESARPELSAAICRMAAEQPGVDRANGLFTIHLAPDQVVAGLSLDFADTIAAAEVEAAVAAIERRVRAAYPEVVTLLIKPRPSAPIAPSASRASPPCSRPSDRPAIAFRSARCRPGRSGSADATISRHGGGRRNRRDRGRDS